MQGRITTVARSGNNRLIRSVSLALCYEGDGDLRREGRCSGWAILLRGLRALKIIG